MGMTPNAALSKDVQIASLTETIQWNGTRPSLQPIVMPSKTSASLPTTVPVMSQTEIAILHALAKSQVPVLLGDLSVAAECSKATAQKTLKILSTYGYVDHPTGSKRKGRIITKSGRQVLASHLRPLISSK